MNFYKQAGSNFLEKALVIRGLNDELYKNIDIGTKVIFLVNKYGVVYGFMIYGISGYAVKPFDIVSSSITTLSYHTINTIKVFTEDVNEYKEGEALQMFVLPNLKNGYGNDVSKVLLKSMVSFMLDLQKQHSKHIKVL